MNGDNSFLRGYAMSLLREVDRPKSLRDCFPLSEGLFEFEHLLADLDQASEALFILAESSTSEEYSKAPPFCIVFPADPHDFLLADFVIATRHLSNPQDFVHGRPLLQVHREYRSELRSFDIDKTRYVRLIADWLADGTQVDGAMGHAARKRLRIEKGGFLITDTDALWRVMGIYLRLLKSSERFAPI